MRTLKLLLVLLALTACRNDPNPRPWPFPPDPVPVPVPPDPTPTPVPPTIKVFTQADFDAVAYDVTEEAFLQTHGKGLRRVKVEDDTYAWVYPTNVPDPQTGTNDFAEFWFHMGRLVHKVLY